MVGLACGLFAACVWLTDQVVWQHARLGLFGLYPDRLLLIALAAAALLAAVTLRVRQRDGSRFVTRLVAAGSATLLTMAALEVVFMFVPRSHNVGYTLATNIWYERYWGTENSLGYRDPEHVRIDGKKLVFVVGDSFTAGAGLPQRSSRFTEVLAARRPDLQVMNLGICGSDSSDEFRRLQAHPLRPDLLVLQYYPNDIDGAAQRAGHAMPAFAAYQDLRSVKMRRLVRGSFLANFVYWQLPHTDGVAYEGFLDKVHFDPEVEREHGAELERFVTWSRETGVPLVVALFPLMEDLEWSRKASADVKQLFVSRGIQVLDVADLIGDLTVAERRVHSHDGHASPVVHERVGAALAERLGR